VQCLVEELGADVNQAKADGATPLFIAARGGQMALVQCLVKDLGADINQAALGGITALMAAAAQEHMEVVVWLIKHGANAQAMYENSITAAILPRQLGASAEQTAYLEARTHCANPGCDGAGLKKCSSCLKVFLC
jgi:ankyrin repeat protein